MSFDAHIDQLELYEERLSIMLESEVEDAEALALAYVAPPAMQLRPYQAQAVLALLDAVADGQHPVCDLPTGSGKSLVIAELCRSLPGRILVATHRKELLSQNNSQLARLLGTDDDLGIYSAGLNTRTTDTRVVFGGVQSIYTKMDVLQVAGPFKAVIVDEAHLVPQRTIDSMYATVFDACPTAQRIGLSATPYRLDNGPIWGTPESWFTHCPVQITVAELTAQGFLAPLVGVRAAADIDLSKVRTRQGDYVQSDLAQIMAEEQRVKEAVSELIVLATQRQTWLAFCVDITHTVMVTQALQDVGVDARMVTGSTPAEERAALIDGLRRQEYRCLVNCQVATTGFDIPDIDCIVLLRPTQSKSLLVQMLGRGTRLKSHAADCLILDYADTLRHHLPLDAMPDYTDSPKIAAQEEEKRQASAAREKERAAKHRGTALGDDALDTTPETWAVAWMGFRVTPSKKQPGKSLLQVSYYCPDRPIPWVSTWLCIEYAGWPRLQAESWFQRREAQCPILASQAETLAKRLSASIRPARILVERQGKFPRVLMEYFD